MPPIRTGEGLNLDSLSIKDNEFIGLWDTGATKTIMTQRVVDHVQPSQTGFLKFSGAYGGEVHTRPVYSVCLYLPNRVCVPELPVALGEPLGCDLLIGMDVIGRGDFSITNFQGKTTFSFRFPSCEDIDFGTRSNPRQISPIKANQKVGRNDPCHCGSGKKFKKCHGR